jgi:tripartite-type tricarboxylate transporter receptor subunit TctC
MLKPSNVKSKPSQLSKTFQTLGVALLVLTGLATAPAAFAADYPSKPITLIVPYKAGGSTETMAQVFAKALGRQLQQKVIVRTRSGAGGAVGSTFVARAPADGYTLMFANVQAITWEPLARPSLEYQLDSFQMIAGISEYQMAFIASPDRPYKTFQELIDYSQKNPGLNVADQGGLTKVFINYIAKKENLKWTAIPTRGGGEMVPFLFGGKVDFAWSGGVHNKYGGKMNVLASCLSERLASAPDAPSVKELYGIAMPGETVFVAPTGVPAQVVATLEAAARRAMDDPDFTKILGRLAFPKRFLSSEEMTETFQQIVSDLETLIAEMDD